MAEEEVVNQGLGEDKERVASVEAMLTEGDKIDPKEANYRPAEDADPGNCAGCINYELPGDPESTCTVVKGEVAEGGVCDMFESAAMEGQGQPGTAPEGMMDEIANGIPGL